MTRAEPVGTPVARLRLSDLLRLGLIGPRTRPIRSALSALGIALGITAVVTITGISASDQAQLIDRFDQLGSNLLTVSPGADLDGQPVPLPIESVPMLGRIAPVLEVSATGATGADIYRTDLVPANQTNGLSVLSARLDLLDVLGAKVSAGRWLGPGTQRLPTVVLGARAARLLAITDPGSMVWLAGEQLSGDWYSVLGILAPNELLPGIDDTALVGRPWAAEHLGDDGTPATVYLRVHPSQVEPVQAVIGATANPAHPEQVTISRPSDLLRVRAEAEDVLSGMILALAGIALLTGGVGIANTMVVGVIERRGEIGLRRALGARSAQIALQFLIEASIVGLLGGMSGVAVAVAAVNGYAVLVGHPAVVPLLWAASGPLLAMLIGATAGLYPALRAARMPPTDALRSA